MSPRIQALETALLQGKIRHGNQAILNMGAATAVVISDASGNRKLTKEDLNIGPKIDGMIAMIMAVYPWIAQTELNYGSDVSWMVA
jgi:phage terminase large subunit-like protein